MPSIEGTSSWKLLGLSTMGINESNWTNLNKGEKVWDRNAVMLLCRQKYNNQNLGIVLTDFQNIGQKPSKRSKGVKIT